MKTTELRDKLNRLNDTLSPGFAYPEDHDGPWAEDVFRECCLLCDDGDAAGLYECGSYKAHDTPNSLYRLLFLLQPKTVDFDDMYKCGLFTGRSIDCRFVVHVEFWKYELALRFYAPKEAIAGKGTFIYCGIPGSDNGVTCSDPDGQAFFQAVIKAVEHEWDVYSGNNFKV